MRRCAFLALLVLALLASSGVRADAERQVRGVRPKDVERYRASTFQCLNGVGSVLAAQVNDEYCDCADGSDEPGTSACANSQFYCRNSGAKARLLPSSRVNDGICDCCDGSDEVASYSQVSCPNTCEEAGRAAREALARDLAAAEAGLTARAALVAKAAATLEEKRSKLAHYEKVMAERKLLLEKANATKVAEEAIETAERERRAAEKAAAAPATPETGAASSEPSAEVPATPDATAPAAAEPAADAAVAAESAEPTENFPYPAEYAYKAPGAEGAAAPAAAEENFPYPAEYAYKPDAGDDATATPAEEGEVASEDEETAAQPEPKVEEEEKEYVHAAAEAAREAFDTLQARVTKLSNKMSALEKSLSTSYGSSGEFLHMDGACFPLPIKQYVYEVCPFGKAAQKEGGSSTSLGQWDGIEQRESDGKWVMKFKNGQSCWQGPQRSMTVVLSCGAVDQPLTVDEPSKCVYEMQMQTPAVCDEAHSAALKQRASGDEEPEHAHARDEL